MPICLTNEEKKEIINSKELNRIIAERLNIHPSTVSRIKRGKQYRKDSCIVRVGKGGKMVCPACGDSMYILIPLDNKVNCICGWSGYYYDMLFVKKMSRQGIERSRRI